MFFFGHLGITLGIVVLGLYHFKIEPTRKLYGAILLGSVLPDLIDKPIGEIMLADSLSNGRLVAHTLLFALYRRRSDLSGLALSGAVLLHLSEDQMWRIPETLFYPLFGLTFPQGIVEAHWWEYFIAAFFRTYSLSPDAVFSFCSEVIGMTILALFAGQRLTINHRNACHSEH
jgi:hypothetical protein